MTPVKEYRFFDVDSCVMCGEPASAAKVLGLRLNQSQGMRPSGRTGIAVTICKCKGCRLVFCNPQPRPRDISDHYGSDPEEYWRESYFRQDATYFSRQIAEAKRLLDFKLGMSAFDVGVGLGKALIALQDAGFEVSGLEPSEPFRQRALALTNLSQDRIYLDTVESHEGLKDAYDFITFGAVLEHLYNPAEAITKTMAWLKPGGILHAEVPSSSHMISKIINFYYKAIGSSYVTNVSPMHSPFHLYEFTLESFRKHGNRTGYEVAHSYVEVCEIMHLPGVVHPPLRRIMERTDTGMQLTVWLRKK